MKRPVWTSRLGFVLAASGSAIGLANIWRFPYLVGTNGGGAFVLLYLMCLGLVGVPVFVSEILIGRTTGRAPYEAFRSLGGSLSWGIAGKMTIITGFLVSSFYSVVAGWILGYLVEAFSGNLHHFGSAKEVAIHHTSLMENGTWALGYHALFMGFSALILVLGVRQGIEKVSRLLVPLLIFVLIALVIKGLSMDGAEKAISFLFEPNWEELSTSGVIYALGQAFFTLSIGQGTMVTYGSYVDKKENLISSAAPIVAMDTIISLLAALAVFSIVFAVDAEPASGPGLMFKTLPMVFSQIPSGYSLAVAFFFLVLLAAVTSQISAMEPMIAYLVESWKLKRSTSVMCVALGAFVVGAPSALSSSILKNVTFGGWSFFDAISGLCSNILIPVGGFLAVILVGWKWGVRQGLVQLRLGADGWFQRAPWLNQYFTFCLKYSTPVLIILVFLNAVGVL